MSHQDKKKKTVTQRKNNLRIEEQTKTTITPTGQNVTNIRRPNRSSTPAHEGMRRNVSSLNSPAPSTPAHEGMRRNVSSLNSPAPSTPAHEGMRRNVSS